MTLFWTAMTRALLMVIDSHDAGTSEAVWYAYKSKRRILRQRTCSSRKSKWLTFGGPNVAQLMR